MAFRDMQGNITIDESSAQADIRKEQQAIEILQEARSALQTVAGETGQMQGLTAAAICEKAQEMIRETDRLISSLESAQQVTKKVIEDYKALDAKYAALMAAQAAAAKK